MTVKDIPGEGKWEPCLINQQSPHWVSLCTDFSHATASSDWFHLLVSVEDNTVSWYVNGVFAGSEPGYAERAQTDAKAYLMAFDPGIAASGYMFPSEGKLVAFRLYHTSLSGDEAERAWRCMADDCPAGFELTFTGSQDGECQQHSENDGESSDHTNGGASAEACAAVCNTAGEATCFAFDWKTGSCYLNQCCEKQDNDGYLACKRESRGSESEANPNANGNRRGLQTKNEDVCSSPCPAEDLLLLNCTELLGGDLPPAGKGKINTTLQDVTCQADGSMQWPACDTAGIPKVNLLVSAQHGADKNTGIVISADGVD